MKILLATTAATLNGGGIGSYNTEFCNVFNDIADLHLLTTEKYSNHETYQKVFSIGLHPLKCYSDYLALVNTLNEENYDVIFNSDSPEIAVLAPFLRSPIITVSHTLNNVPAIRAGVNSKYVTKIIALSKAGKRYLEKRFSIHDENKVTYLYNFVHHEEVVSTEKKEKRRILNIVFPGGASPMKYVEMVIGAVNKLSKTSLEFNFYWYGNDILPLHRISLPKKVSDLIPKDDRVHLSGKVSRDESMRYIDSSNIFLLPSRAEGCPVSLMEALCTGCIPIVGSGKHVCREILEDGGFGIIVKKGSSSELYKAMAHVISNPNLYLESYRKTLQYSKENISEKVWKTRMLEIVNSVRSEEKKCIQLTKFSLFKSRLRYGIPASLKVLEDRWLSLRVYFKLNIMYIKYKLNGSI